MKRICLFLLISAGCAPIISKKLREEVSRDITFKEVIKNPEAYKGKEVLFSGIILGSKNIKEGTLVEILQKPADMEGRPKEYTLVHFGYSKARKALVGLKTC